MKDYLVDVKFIQSTNMMVNASCKKDALKKVESLLKNYSNSNKDINFIFDGSYEFKYKAKKIKKVKSIKIGK